VYNTRSDIGPYLEMLAPTAFRSALASPDLDVRGLLNHDPNMLLARTPNTLRLSSDSHGLQFEMDLNLDTTVANDVRAMVEAGLITGCSFAFVAGQEDWTTHEGRDLRVHTSVARIQDVSVVTYPAYSDTAVSLRSKPTTAINGRTQIVLAKSRATYRKVN
jgi:HK97 family phage prohead protease